MSGHAIFLVLSAALVHAVWNLLLKRLGTRGPLVWLASALSCLLYAPIVWWLEGNGPTSLPPIAWGGILVSGAFQAAYLIALNQTYRHADYSLAYPMIRGCAPLLAFAAAMLWLGERPHPLQMVGAGLLVSGLFWLTGGAQVLRHGQGRLLPMALLTAALTGLAGVWDKYVLSATPVSPLVLNMGGMTTMVLLLAPTVRGFDAVRSVLRAHAGAVLLLAALMPLSYWLILSALQLAPVSVVAPLREIGVLFAVLLGRWLMGEGATRARLAAAGLMVAGLLAIVA